MSSCAAAPRWWGGRRYPGPDAPVGTNATAGSDARRNCEGTDGNAGAAARGSRSCQLADSRRIGRASPTAAEGRAGGAGSEPRRPTTGEAAGEERGVRPSTSSELRRLPCSCSCATRSRLACMARTAYALAGGWPGCWAASEARLGPKAPPPLTGSEPGRGVPGARECPPPACPNAGEPTGAGAGKRPRGPCTGASWGLAPLATPLPAVGMARLPGCPAARLAWLLAPSPRCASVKGRCTDASSAGRWLGLGRFASLAAM